MAVASQNTANLSLKKTGNEDQYQSQYHRYPTSWSVGVEELHESLFQYPAGVECTGCNMIALVAMNRLLVSQLRPFVSGTLGQRIIYELRLCLKLATHTSFGEGTCHPYVMTCFDTGGEHGRVYLHSVNNYSRMWQ